MQRDRVEVKMYSDFKSPYAYLAFDPAFALEDKYHISPEMEAVSAAAEGQGRSAASIPNTK